MRSDRDLSPSAIFSTILAWIFFLAIGSIPIVLAGYLIYRKPLFAIPIVLLLALIAVIPSLRFRRKRAKFIKKISRQYANSDLVSLHWISNKYCSSKKISGHADLEIETTNIVFHVMFLSANKKRSTVAFAHDGTFYDMTLPVFLGNVGNLLGFRERTKRYPLSFEITEHSEKENKRVLLLNPVPGDIAFYDYEAATKRIGGPGEKLSNYTIDNTDSLIRSIDRYLDNNTF